jgi:hypothetical protein
MNVLGERETGPVFARMTVLRQAGDIFPGSKHRPYRFESDFATTVKTYTLSRSMVACSDTVLKKIPWKNLKCIRD